MTILSDAPVAKIQLRLVAILLTFFFCWSLSALPARAEFYVCNQTLDVVNVAIGQDMAGTFQTEGWWTIGSNQCATVIREALTNRYVYVFATDVFGQALLEGTQRMCVGDKKFSRESTQSCWQRGLREVLFFEVDTEAVERWTLFLTEPPPAGN